MADLTVADLERALEDDRHLGFGFAGVRYFDDERLRDCVMVEVVAQANRLGLDYEGLFLWANSKFARWLCDSASFMDGGRYLVGDIKHNLRVRLVPDMLNADRMAALGGDVL